MSRTTVKINSIPGGNCMREPASWRVFCARTGYKGKQDRPPSLLTAVILLLIIAYVTLYYTLAPSHLLFVLFSICWVLVIFDMICTRSGSRVAIASLNHHWYIEALFGIVLAGGYVAHINFSLGTKAIPIQLVHCRPHAVLMDDSLLVLGPVVKRLRGGCALLYIGENDLAGSGENYVHVGKEMAKTTVPLGLGIGQQRLAMMFYTAGDDHKPKPRSVSFTALAASASSLQFPSGTVMVLSTPLFTQYGLTGAIAAALTGTALSLTAEMKPVSILHTIHRHRATTAVFAPSLMKRIMSVPDHDCNQLDLSCIHTILTGHVRYPNWLEVDVKKRFPRAQLRTGFGMGDDNITHAPSLPRSSVDGGSSSGGGGGGGGVGGGSGNNHRTSTGTGAEGGHSSPGPRCSPRSTSGTNDKSPRAPATLTPRSESTVPIRKASSELMITQERTVTPVVGGAEEVQGGDSRAYTPSNMQHVEDNVSELAATAPTTQREMKRSRSLHGIAEQAATVGGSRANGTGMQDVLHHGSSNKGKTIGTRSNALAREQGPATGALPPRTPRTSLARSTGSSSSLKDVDGLEAAGTARQIGLGRSTDTGIDVGDKGGSPVGGGPAGTDNRTMPARSPPGPRGLNLATMAIFSRDTKHSSPRDDTLHARTSNDISLEEHLSKDIEDARALQVPLDPMWPRSPRMSPRASPSSSPRPSHKQGSPRLHGVTAMSRLGYTHHTATASGGAGGAANPHSPLRDEIYSHTESSGSGVAGTPRGRPLRATKSLQQITASASPVIIVEGADGEDGTAGGQSRGKSQSLSSRVEVVAELSSELSHIILPPVIEDQEPSMSHTIEPVSVAVLPVQAPVTDTNTSAQGSAARPRRSRSASQSRRSMAAEAADRQDVASLLQGEIASMQSDIDMPPST